MRDWTRTLTALLTTTALAAAGLMGCDESANGETNVSTSAAPLTQEAPMTCGERAAAILAGQYMEAGTVVVSNTADSIIVDVQAAVESGWLMEEVHVYAGTQPPETVAPGQFPYKATFDGPTDRWVLEIPLADVIAGDACGQVVYLAVHTSSVQVVDGVVVNQETGWGFGTPFDGARWGWYMEQPICCEPEPEPETGCTLTQGYWKTHNSEARNKKLRVDWPMPEDEANTMCGETWVDILHSNPAGGDAWTILAHQFIAARLNVANGASTTPQVDAALADAEAILADTCGGLQASEAPFELDLAAILDAYNNGLLGPAHCE